MRVKFTFTESILPRLKITLKRVSFWKIRQIWNKSDFCSSVFPSDSKEFIKILVCAKRIFNDVANEKLTKLV